VKLEMQYPRGIKRDSSSMKPGYHNGTGEKQRSTARNQGEEEG